jgi:uncharacterized protein (DUF1499 family)
MNEETKEAIGRVAELIAGKKVVNVRKGSEHIANHVEAQAADIVKACDAVLEPDKRISALRLGSDSGDEDAIVNVRVVDLKHLLDTLNGAGA